MTEELVPLLQRAASGDVGAFMCFYDATSGYAFSLALARARAAGLPGALVRRTAEQETVARYTRAWTRAGEHRDSGLSPLAWLLTLDGPPLDEAACA